MDELRDCITEHIQTYCEANPDNFKCTMFERCKDGEVISKNQCFQDLCKEPVNVDKFECLALGCKQNYDKSHQKLNCIKEACASNEDVNICKKIKACEAENSGPRNTEYWPLKTLDGGINICILYAYHPVLSPKWLGLFK